MYSRHLTFRFGRKANNTQGPLQAYGAQAVVVSVDPKRVYVKDPATVKHKTTKTKKAGPSGEQYVWWQCTVKGGREGRDLGAIELCQAVEQLGAGEILLNCIDNDGQVMHTFQEQTHAIKGHAYHLPVTTGFQCFSGNS